MTHLPRLNLLHQGLHELNVLRLALQRGELAHWDRSLQGQRQGMTHVSGCGGLLTAAIDVCAEPGSFGVLGVVLGRF